MPTLPLPEADAATAATIKDWLARFAACVREVDYASAYPFWHDAIVIFGTYQELVRSRQAWTDTQWDNVWPRTADFDFDLANTEVLASPDGAMAVAVTPSSSQRPFSSVNARVAMVSPDAMPGSRSALAWSS